MRSLRLLPLPIVLPLALALAAPAAGLQLPPLTQADWQARAPAADANAPAVVLVQKAEFQLRDLAKQEISSRLEVAGRIKVLDERGVSLGEVTLPHSRYMRLLSFQGKTLLPDGRVIPVPKDAKFERKVSERLGVSVTAVAFPAVEPGAILEYSYEMRFDSILYPEAWYLSSDLPVLEAEVTYHIPKTLQARTWAKDPFQTGLKTDSGKGIHGAWIRASAKNLPPVVVDTHGYAWADLATQFLVITTAYADELELLRLMESWESTCRIFEDWFYGAARRKDGDLKKQVKQLAAPHGKDREAIARAIFGFVRDGIETEPVAGIGLAEGSTLAKVLASRRGDYAEKALLLEAMLDAAGVPAQLVWASDRSWGRADLSMPNPGWFDRPIVEVEIGGQPLYLDPSDRSIGFGRLLAGLEGTPALRFDPKKPQPITLPVSPAEASRRQAKVALTVDAQGALAGGGELLLTGHHAQRELAAAAGGDLAESWQKRLEQSLGELTVSGVTAEGDADAAELRLAFQVTQREESVLGDETALFPSLPLGPARQPFAIEARRSPVQLPFADSESVELTVTWPQGWRVAGTPQPASHDGAMGSFTSRVAVDEAARSLTYERKLDVAQRDAATREAFDALRQLYSTAEANDAQILALVRR